MSASPLLDRLDRVKQTGPGRWVARCPAHEDRSPSLSIREVDDRVLLHDFGGCETSAVLAALGLSLSDLFDKPLAQCAGPVSRIPAVDLLVILDHEITVAVLILHEIISTRKAGQGHFERLMRAAARMGKARVIANPAKVTLR
jgi:hypothetical protein